MSSTTGKAFDVGLFKRVMTFVQPYRGVFWTSFLLTILLSAFGIIRPILSGWMVDAVTLNARISDPAGDASGVQKGFGLVRDAIGATGAGGLLAVIFGVVVLLLVIEALIQFYQAYWTSWLGQTVTYDMRRKLFARILASPMRFFDRTPVGTLVTRTVSDIETIEDIFSQGLLLIMGDLLKLVVVIIVMFVYDWELALWSMAPIPVLLWATNIFKNSIRKSFQDVRTQVARLNAFVQEHIQGMAIVQVFAREKQEQDKFGAINKEHRDAHIRSVFAYSVFFPVVEVLSAVSLAFLIHQGVGNVLDQRATFGELVAYILFINLLYRPIRQLADRFNVLQMGMVGSERVFGLLDKPADGVPGGDRSAVDVQGNLAFEHLTFGYDPAEPVLKDISFHVAAGEMVALVGATGSGKSSIINVLSRAYEFQGGSVTIDGYDIRSYRTEELRRTVAVVLQDVFLFGDTVHNNVTMHDPTISREQVVEAAKAVGAHELIMRLPQGYDTSVQERGSILSVGQRQLLAFMRAYVHQPRILVLDEATSSIDSASEQLVQAATEKITQGRTSIVIAHRLSTIQHADRILVLDKGRIVEEGSPAELLAQVDGAYRKLYDLQFR